MKYQKRRIILLVSVCIFFMSGCSQNAFYNLNPGDYINVKLFIYDDNDRINLISANTDTEYTIAHSSLVDNRSGNWCINIESPSYIFVYLSRNEGQLSWGDIIKTDIGNVVSMERNLSMGNHAVAVNNTAIGFSRITD